MRENELYNQGYSMNWFLHALINNQIDAMVQRYARLYALRVDFFYKKGSDRFKNSSPRSMEYELRLLMTEMMAYPAIVGYFWVVEWTPDHGFHAHAVIWLNGHKTQRTYPFAEKAGSFWQELTKQEGFHYRCEYHENYSANINMPINYNDPASIANIRYILSYLAKEEQKEGLCCYASSEVPLPSGAGRPRSPVHSTDWSS